MEISQEFRKNAHQCLTLAHEAYSLESRAHWMEMARLWFALAGHAEEREASSGSALLNDMARLWIALARQLAERLDGRNPASDSSGRQRNTIN